MNAILRSNRLAIAVPHWWGALLAVLGAAAAEETAAAIDNPFATSLSYTLDAMANVAGGIDQGIALLGKLDAGVAIEGAAFGIERA